MRWYETPRGLPPPTRNRSILQLDFARQTSRGVWLPLGKIDWRQSFRQPPLFSQTRYIGGWSGHHGFHLPSRDSGRRTVELPVWPPTSATKRICNVGLPKRMRHSNAVALQVQARRPLNLVSPASKSPSTIHVFSHEPSSNSTSEDQAGKNTKPNHVLRHHDRDGRDVVEHDVPDLHSENGNQSAGDHD